VVITDHALPNRTGLTTRGGHQGPFPGLPIILAIRLRRTAGRSVKLDC